MKQLIILLSGIAIAGGAAAQTDKLGVNAPKAVQTDRVDRQAPITSERDKQLNPLAEPPESANSVSPDFQGSSSQAATSSGMGQPKPDKRDSAAAKKADKTSSEVQDVEDKPKK